MFMFALTCGCLFGRFVCWFCLLVWFAFVLLGGLLIYVACLLRFVWLGLCGLFWSFAFVSFLYFLGWFVDLGRLGLLVSLWLVF